MAPAKTQANTPSMARLAQEFASLPGIGPKSAQRIAHHLIRLPRENAAAIVDAIVAARENTLTCSRCHNLAEDDPCAMCADHRRDTATICVVEDPADIAAIESTRTFKGTYHVLQGALAPLQGVTPAELRLDELAQKAIDPDLQEIILATNPTVEGEATANYIVSQMSRPGLKITRLARGLAVGGHVDTTDQTTLTRALQGREEMTP